MAEALLDTMHALGHADFSEMNIQAFSVWLFHEPNFFEDNIERHLLMLILRFHPRMTNFTSEQSNDEILGMVGLHRSSEILEFCGPLSLVIKGISVDFSAFSEGSSLNARMIPLIEKVETSRISRMIVVEHHACYEHLLRSGAGPDELVIWHGSIYSCRKDRFLQMIAAALPACSEILFWGDIDLGGFTHYLNLCGLLDHPVKTWRMDSSTLVSKQSLAAEISESNRDLLEKARKNPFYQPVAGMLDCMLETGLHLNQTAFLPRR